MIDRLLDHVAEHILAQLDVESLCSAELVSKEWRHIVLRTRTWLLLLQRQVSKLSNIRLPHSLA